MSARSAADHPPSSGDHHSPGHHQAPGDRRTPGATPAPAPAHALAAGPAPRRHGPLGDRPGRTAALLALAVSAVSTAAILVRVAEAPALALAFWRNAAGAVLLAPFALRAGFRPRGAQLGALVAAGAALAVHFALFIGSLSLTTVASSVVLVSASPVVVGLLSAMLATDAPSRRGWMGIAIGTAGAVVVALADHVGSPAPAPLLGDAMAFGGAVLFAVYLLLGRALRRRLPVAVYAAWVYGVAAILLLGACLVTGTTLGLGDAGWPATTWWAIVGLIVGPQLLGHTVFNTVLARVTPSVVALTTLAEPVGSALLAALLLAELPSVGFFLGAPLVLGGVWLGTTRGRAARAAGH
jgi:drug/metabolite transporter (DMT)-like permease